MTMLKVFKIRSENHLNYLFPIFNQTDLSIQLIILDTGRDILDCPIPALVSQEMEENCRAVFQMGSNIYMVHSFWET